MMRVWYLFPYSPTIRSIAVMAYIITTLASAVLSGVLWPYVRLAGMAPPGTEPPRTPMFAWLFVPSLLFHSLLFALKVYRLVMSPKHLRRGAFLWRFLKE